MGAPVKRPPRLGGAGLAGFVEQKNLIDDTTVKKALGEFQDDLGG